MLKDRPVTDRSASDTARFLSTVDSPTERDVMAEKKFCSASVQLNVRLEPSEAALIKRVIPKRSPLGRRPESAGRSTPVSSKPRCRHSPRGTPKPHRSQKQRRRPWLGASTLRLSITGARSCSHGSARLSRSDSACRERLSGRTYPRGTSARCPPSLRASHARCRSTRPPRAPGGCWRLTLIRLVAVAPAIPARQADAIAQLLTRLGGRYVTDVSPVRRPSPVRRVRGRAAVA